MWYSLMERCACGRRVSRKLSRLGLELIHSTRLEEVHWKRGHVILPDRLNYGTGGLDTFITKPFPKQRKVVTGMLEFKNDHEGVCQGCAKGKHTRRPFPSSVTKTSNVLQVIPFDLSSVLPVTSLGGFSYYMTFIDDFSHKT